MSDLNSIAKENGLTLQQVKSFKHFLDTEPVLNILYKNISFLLDKGKRIQTIEMNPNMESYTDGKKVVISGMPPILKMDPSSEEMLVMMRIALAHEIQHDNSSDFKLIGELQKWFCTLMKKYKINDAISNNIAQVALNILEDGRIDEIVVQRFPGYLKMMRFVNLAIRNGCIVKEVADQPEKELSDFLNQLLSYSITGLNLQGISVYHGKRLETEFYKVKGFIDEAVASSTAKGCFEATKKLLETAAPYIADLSKNQSAMLDMLEQIAKDNYSQSEDTREEEKGSSSPSKGPTVRVPKKQSGSNSGSSDEGEDEADQGKGNSGAGQEKDESNSDDGTEKSAQKNASSKDGKKNSSEDGSEDGSDEKSKDAKNGSENGNSSNSKDGNESDSDKDGDSSQSKGKKKSKSGDGKNSQESISERAKRVDATCIEDVIGAGFSEDESPLITEQEMRDMIKQIKEEIQHTKSSIRSQHVDQAKKTNLTLNEQNVINKNYREKPMLEEKILPIKKIPTEGFVLKEGKALHEKLKTILMQRKTQASNHRKGYLDPNKCWRVYVNSTDIMKRKDPPKLSDTAFYELIDGSGSMSDSAYYGAGVNKLTSALTTAAILEEGMKGLAATKMSIFRAGWNSQVSHTILKDFDQQEIGNRCFDAIPMVSPNNGNMDGYSIRLAAMDLSKRKEKNKILVILSDGLPSAYGSPSAGKEDVRSAVNWARNHGIIVVSIMFGEKRFLQNNYKDYKEMYQKDIIATNPADIRSELEKLLIHLIK